MKAGGAMAAATTMTTTMTTMGMHSPLTSALPRPSCPAPLEGRPRGKDWTRPGGRHGHDGAVPGGAEPHPVHADQIAEACRPHGPAGAS